MIKKIAAFGVKRALGPRSNTWVYTSGALSAYRFIKKQTGRREVIDLSKSKPGDSFVIEHLPITHKEQIKQLKKSAKQDKAAAKNAKSAAKSDRKAAKQLSRAAKKAKKNANKPSRAQKRAERRAKRS